MKTTIKGKHMEITEAIDSYVTKRLETLDKFLAESALVEVEVSKTTNHHKSGDIFRAEVNITNRGELTRAVAEEADLYAAIDKIRDEAIHVLSSKKGKKQSLWKRGKLRIKNMLRMADVTADETEGNME